MEEKDKEITGSFLTEEARLYALNAEFYRKLLFKCAVYLGEEAFDYDTPKYSEIPELLKKRISSDADYYAHLTNEYPQECHNNVDIEEHYDDLAYAEHVSAIVKKNIPDMDIEYGNVAYTYSVNEIPDGFYTPLCVSAQNVTNFSTQSVTSFTTSSEPVQLSLNFNPLPVDSIVTLGSMTVNLSGYKTFEEAIKEAESKEESKETSEPSIRVQWANFKRYCALNELDYNDPELFTEWLSK